MRRTAIVGLGDAMQGDDGVGTHVVRALRGELPDEIACYSVGGTTDELLDVLMRHGEVIVVEAVRGDGPPGTVYRLTPSDLDESRSISSRFAHGHGVGGVLRASQQLGSWCHVVVIGVEPATTGRSADLSPQVWAALPVVTECVVRELAACSGRRAG